MHAARVWEKHSSLCRVGRAQPYYYYLGVDSFREFPTDHTASVRAPHFSEKIQTCGSTSWRENKDKVVIDRPCRHDRTSNILDRSRSHGGARYTEASRQKGTSGPTSPSRGDFDGLCVGALCLEFSLDRRCRNNNK